MTCTVVLFYANKYILAFYRVHDSIFSSDQIICRIYINKYFSLKFDKYVCRPRGERWGPRLTLPQYPYVVAWFFSSPEPKAQVNFPDQNVSVVRRRCCYCRRNFFQKHWANFVQTWYKSHMIYIGR